MAHPGNLAERVAVAHKVIKLRRQLHREAELIAKAFSLSPVAARVLAARGYKADSSLEHFISPTLKRGVPGPEGIKNIDGACELVRAVVAAKEGIAICCDFDVDGLSGGAQMFHFLRSAGCTVRAYVPDRFTDGYGLNERIVRRAAEEGAKLLIAIDFGTTNERELTLARSLNLKTLVVDHHHVGSLRPPADVFINPNQRGCGFAQGILCASGLVWFLLVALRRALGETDQRFATIDVRSYLDLASLGTICDMVPLTGVNRIIAKRGLDILSTTERPGLVALKKASGIKSTVGCSDVSFGIGPRINAAGRMVHGEMVLELLTTSDLMRAREIAGELNRLNEERQATELEVKERALELINERGELPAGLVLWDPTFHTGVVGIVAQRLVETYYRPTVVLGLESPGLYKGSVRGIREFNVVETLQEVGEHLIKYGGHAGAGGVSLLEENLEAFEQAWAQACASRLEGIPTIPVADADTEVELGDLNEELVIELQRFAPFGMGNPAPQLLLRELTVHDVRQLKGVHTKAILGRNKGTLTGLMWRQVDHPALIRGATVNVVCRPDVSVYNGLRSVQVTLQAVERV